MSQSCSLANLASTSASGTVWNARSQAEHHAPARWNFQLPIMQGRLRPGLRRVQAFLTLDDVAMEGILGERTAALRAGAEDAWPVRFIVRKQQPRFAFAIEESLAEVIVELKVAQRLHLGIIGPQAHAAPGLGPRRDERLGHRCRPPRPGVAKPQ